MSRFGAILWVRRRLAIHEFSGLAGAVNLSAGIALLTVAALGALAVATGLGFVLHLAVASGDTDALSTAWLITLYTAAFFALGVPIVVGAGQTSFDPSVLLRYPISRSSLYHLSLASEAASKVHLAWYPTLAAAAVTAVVLPGRGVAGSMTLLTLFAITQVTWSHALLLVIRRVLRQRRLRELATVLGLAAVASIAFLPAAIDLTADDADRRIEELLTIPDWVETMSAALPPSICAQGLLACPDGRTAVFLYGMLGLGLWFAGGWFIGRMAFDRLLQTDASPSSRSATGKSRPVALLAASLDRLSAPLGAIVFKELRYLFQSGVGKLSLLVMPGMTALTVVLSGRHPGFQVLGFDLDQLVFYGIMVYAAALTGYLQVNIFAWEGTGIAAYFTAPIHTRDVFLGKNLATWMFNILFVIEGVVIWGLVRSLPNSSVVIGGLLVFASTTVLMSLVGNFTSVAFPLDRSIVLVTSAASPLGTLVMIGCLLVGLTFVACATLGAAVVGSTGLQPVIAFGIFAVVVGAYRVSLHPASRVLDERREDVFRALGA